MAEGALRARLAAVLTAVVEVILAQPAAARMALAEVAAVGQPGLARRRALTSGLHEPAARARPRSTGAPAMSEAALTVLAGGTLHVFDGHLRAGRLRPLRPAAAESPPGARCTRALRHGGCRRATRSSRATAGDRAVATAARAPRAAARLCVRCHQRARILDAVLEVSAHHGFEAASVRELIVAAGLSTEAFYSHFPAKEDAWDTVFDQAFVELFAAVWHAALAESGRTAKVTAAVDAALGLLAASPEQGRGSCSSTCSPRAGLGCPAIDDALKAFTRVAAGATAGPKGLPKSLPGAMVARDRRTDRRLGARRARDATARAARGAGGDHPDPAARAGGSGARSRAGQSAPGPRRAPPNPPRPATIATC